MKMFRKSEGFTLVELMVVVLIIGILVAIAIPVFNAAKANAQRKSCYANQRTIEGSAQTYNAESGSLPTVGLVSASGLIPTFIKVAPICPTNKAVYSINASGSVSSILGTEDLTITTPLAEVHEHF